MPNIKSAKKRMKTSAVSRDLNKSVKTKVASTRRKMYETIAEGDKPACEELFRSYSSILDKAAKKGVLKSNAAARRKSRIAARIAAL